MKKRIGSVIWTLAMACVLTAALCGEARAEEHNHSGWQEWTETGSLPTTSGSYYLTENVTLLSTWSVPTGKTNLCLNGKSITLTADTGSVIKIDSGTTLNLYDEGTDTHVINDSTTINGGLITGGKGTNNTSLYGGGVYIDGSSSNHGTLNMYGGTIAGNQATYGGGVCLDSVGATFTMYGGTISGNTANGAGGLGAGVYFDSGTMTVSGTAKVKENVDGAKKGNVYLNDKTLNIGSGGLQDGAEIWVKTYKQPGNGYVENPYPITSQSAADQNASYFHSDFTSYEIEAMSDGKVGLASKCTITFHANGGEGTMTPQKIYTGKETALEANTFTRTGYTFVRWNTKEDGSGEGYSDSEAVKLYGATTTLYAQWTATPATAPAITIPTETITAPYNGESSNITVEVDLASGYTITGYTWYRATKSDLSDKQSFQTWTGSTTDKTFSCTHSSGLSAGTYYYCCEITVRRDDNGKIATARSEVITATVTKADPTYTAPTGLTATTGQTLADVTLPNVSGGVWTWNNSSTSVGEAGEHSFPATYTPSDTINYNTATAGLTVTVKPPHVHNGVDGVTFMPWNGTTSLPSTPGSYYLTDNVTLSATWTVPAGVTNLCLNGRSIKRNGSSAVVTIDNSGTTLNLYDEAGDAAGTITHSSGTGRGVEVKYGTFNMYGGKITRNSINGSNGGGGVYIVYNGRFTMKGGEISGNTANGIMGIGKGGGVSLLSGKFCMDGGKITGNTATGNSSSVYSNGKGNGGGVYIDGSNSKFTMTGGEITGNTALSNGGGVYVRSGTFEIPSNPNISGNTKSGASASNLYIYNPYGKLVISSELDDSVKSQEIGVSAYEYAYAFTSGWTTQMGDADPADYFTSERDGYQIYLVGEEARLTYQRTFTFAANGGSGTMAAQTVLRGLPFTFPANEFTPPDGKSFKAWQIDSKEYRPGADEQFYNNTDTTFTVKALWGYAVTFAADGGSAVAPLTVAENGTVSEPAAPTRSGYTFDGWYKDEALTTEWNFDTDTVTGATTLYAKWTAIPTPPPTPAPAPSYDDYEEPEPTVTVTAPVSGDENTVNVTVSVTGTAATLRSADIKSALSGNGETGDVVIDVSNLKQDVTSITIPAKTVAAIAEAVADETNPTDSLTVKLTDGAMTFDAAAVAAIAKQAGGSDLRLNLDSIRATRLKAAQRTAVAELEVEAVYDAYMTVGGRRITDFQGGSATVTVTYTLKDGQVGRGVVVWYVAEGGEKTTVPTVYDDETVRFTIEHFSNYVVAYDKDRAACPQDETCPIAAFVDADPTAWYHDGVHYVLENGIMSGYGNGLFGPGDTTSRAEMAQILWNLEGKPVVNYLLPFADTAEGKWYTEAVRWAVSEGVMEGYGGAESGTFGPNDPATREQVAVILYRYAQKKGEGFTGEWAFPLDFPDAGSVSDWAYEALCWMTMKEVIEGTDTGPLAPQGPATRAEIAAMLMRFCKREID